MGEVEVPASARWAAQTQRAVENFPISGMRLERGADRTRSARIKAAAAKRERLARRHRGGRGRRDRAPPRTRSRAASTTTEFPIDVYQTGSGTCRT